MHVGERQLWCRGLHGVTDRLRGDRGIARCTCHHEPRAEPPPRLCQGEIDEVARILEDALPAHVLHDADHGRAWEAVGADAQTASYGILMTPHAPREDFIDHD